MMTEPEPHMVLSVGVAPRNAASITAHVATKALTSGDMGNLPDVKGHRLSDATLAGLGYTREPQTEEEARAQRWQAAFERLLRLSIEALSLPGDTSAAFAVTEHSRSTTGVETRRLFVVQRRYRMGAAKHARFSMVLHIPKRWRASARFPLITRIPERPHVFDGWYPGIPDGLAAETPPDAHP